MIGPSQRDSAAFGRDIGASGQYPRSCAKYGAAFVFGPDGTNIEIVRRAPVAQTAEF